MKKASNPKGFFLSFILNLVFHFWFIIAALLCVVLHFWINTPLWLTWIVLGIWIIYSFILSVLVKWGNAHGGDIDTPRENKNPYSAKNEDVFKDMH